jgi:CheY-like chemotaxis protein
MARCQALGIPLHLGKPIKQTELWNAILIALGAPSPLTPSPLAPRQCLPAQRPIAFSEDGGQLSILLVEDNTVNQKLAVRLLEKWGHQVIVAGNGKEALSVLERQRFDLVLMDVQMPEMDGLEATATIRSRERSTNSHLPIIAMTAHAMKGDRERCLAAGMDSYLTKPLQIKELHAVIQNAILKTRHDTALFDNLPNLQPPHSCDEAENEKIL